MKIQDLIEYSTIPDLERNIEVGFPRTTKRQHSTDTIRVAQLRIVPYVGTKSIFFKALCLNTDGGHKYDTQIFVGGGAQFETGETDETVKFTASNGNEYNMHPVTLTDQYARVRCNCPDFYYRFAHYDHNDQSLWGPAPPPYQRKTDNRPPVNPDQVPGMCKHLIKTVDALRQAGLVV